MTRLRLLCVTVIVVALVGLTSAFSGTSAPTPASLDRSPVPAVRADGDLGSTWYCAAGTASVPTQGALIVSNPTDRPVTARLTGFTATGPSPTKVVQVPAKAPLVIDVGPTFGDPTASVIVESTSTMLSVDHQLVADGGADRDACVTSTSDQWSFPTSTTTADAGVRLTLFNPFPGDAGVDISIGLDTATRVPSSLTGLVVPAGTVKVVDLGTAASRRDQFAATVHTRSGRVVAEIVQTFDGSKGPKGLRMAAGVPAPAKRWAIAGGFTGTGVSEHLVVQNPGTSPVHALVQVTPYGGAQQAPEPLQIDVESGRFVVVDLSAESRIPGIGYHSIEVEADHPVVVARTIAISGPAEAVPDPSIIGRPGLAGGVAISTGTPVLARDWMVPSIDAGQDPDPVVVVHNPGAGIAVVTLEALTGGAAAPVASATKAEIAPGDSMAFPVGPIGPTPAEASIRISSTEPVAVERVTTYPVQPDLGFDPAVPVHSTRRPLQPLR